MIFLPCSLFWTDRIFPFSAHPLVGSCFFDCRSGSSCCPDHLSLPRDALGLVFVYQCDKIAAALDFARFVMTVVLGLAYGYVNQDLPHLFVFLIFMEHP